MLLKLTLLAVSFTFGSAAPNLSKGSVRRSGPERIPSIWSKHPDAIDGTSAITFTFGLLPANGYEPLETRLAEIAETRGAWLTDAELASYVSPSAEAKAALADSIKALNARVISSTPAGDMVTVESSIEAASKFFNAEFAGYRYGNESTIIPRTTSYTIPASIAPFVHDVWPIATFGNIRHASSSKHAPSPAEAVNASINVRDTPSSCHPLVVTSACISALYGYGSYTPTSRTGPPRIGVLGFQGNSFSAADLKEYLSIDRPDAVNYTMPVVTAYGAKNNGLLPGPEADLDTQTVAGLVYPLPSTFYDIGTAFTAGDMWLAAFQLFIGMPTASRPSVITMSYTDDEPSYTREQAQAMCNAAMQLTALGTTIVVSSGDNGVDGNGGEICEPFIPRYPSGCPYLLSVGATQNFGPEVMADKTLALFFSGAGFSNYFPTPSYQQAVLPTYVASLGSEYASYFNRSGRAFPDVSAQGSLQQFVTYLLPVVGSGTSYSAPIIASGITLLNDLLTTAGKPTVGWAQPFLYQHPSAWTDVTSGGSYGCNATVTGLPAGVGYDVPSGLGTPNFAKLRAIYGI